MERLPMTCERLVEGLMLTGAAIIIPIVIVMASGLTTKAHARWKEEYAQMYTPEERRWFNNQLVPGGPMKGGRCCSIADGEYAEEDIRCDQNECHYWTRFTEHPDWMMVPDELVITTPNKRGKPTVWWGKDSGNGQVFIRCYAVGAGT